MATTSPTWPGLGPTPDDALVELAERLTGALAEPEVIRLLAEEVSRRVRPTHWCLLLGDRDVLRVEHVGGRAAPSLLRVSFETGSGLVWRALESFEAQMVSRPAAHELLSLVGLSSPYTPEDAVAIPFGGFEVVGCLEMVDALRVGPSGQDLAALRQALRLGGVGVRNARRHRRLSHGSGADEITGLEGPDGFRAALERELQRARRTGRPPAVALVDLDHFKAVNQLHGRLVGSSVLAEVGAIVQMAIRSTDLASRWCGDTFALLLPETSLEGATRVAARVQERLRTAQLEVGVHTPLGLTASVGLALFTETLDDADQLLHRAEAAMRAAQSAGTVEALVVAE